MSSTMAAPFVREQEERPYWGLRFEAPYRGMFASATAEGKRLDAWIRRNRSLTLGPRFLRYHVIDMRGTMQLEVGVFGPVVPGLPGPVEAGLMPAGRYATLVYRGLGLAANRTLLTWIEERGWRCDRADQPGGDAFAGRYEAYLTDPKVEPRKKQWEIELAIRLED